MGLDMYLTARRYLSDYEEQERKISEAIAKLELGNMNFRIKEVSCDVGYWRKANAIHRWFVQNVQNGNEIASRTMSARKTWRSFLKSAIL